MKDEHGDRMKLFEKNNVVPIFPQGVPIIARIDGRSFSKLTKGLKRPFDEKFTECMVETTQFLVEETGARIGYTQSDEITLVWYNDDHRSQMWFGGKMQKMVSQLAAQATVKFNELILEAETMCELCDGDDTYVGLSAKNPTFDARVWFVPTKQEAVNAVRWREKDAVKNSISMLARHHFSAKELHKKSGVEMLEKLFYEKGVNWEDEPAAFRSGTYVLRKQVTRKLSEEEREDLPEKHQARENPDMEFKRNIYEVDSELELLDNLGALSVIFD